MTPMKRSASCILGAVLVGFVAGHWLGGAPSASWHASAGPSAAAAQSPLAAATKEPNWKSSTPRSADLTPTELTNIRVYESANRSVVNIDTQTVRVDHFFRLQRESEGSGSGAIVDRQGHIITNYHVIDGARDIRVTLASNEQYPAELVGGDKEHDIAVLKIDAPAEDLDPIELGASDSLSVGQRVFALGNPFGWEGTMSTGIISSLNRNLPSRVPGRMMQSLIQTDAAMNPGNSGGPLLDTSGRMVGMCVAIATRTGQNSGVGFAIPINRIRWILPELIEHGRVVRADIGISHVMETSAGLVIARVVPGGPADAAGLRGFRKVVERRQQGPFVYETESIDRSHADRILAVDGEAVTTGAGFRDKVWEYQPGQVVTLTILREGRQSGVQVALGSN